LGVADSLLAILHLCDSLFPVGAFAYSDGLEAAITLTDQTSETSGSDPGVRLLPHAARPGVSAVAVDGGARGARGQTWGPDPEVSPGAQARCRPDTAIEFLRGWLDATLEESIGRADGPAVWAAWRAVHDDDWAGIAALDQDAAALRPSLAARKSTRALGLRLLTTWSALHPEPRLARALAHARAGRIGPALPVAFAVACASAGVGRHESVEAFAYTRLAGATSAAMRLLPIGQTGAHGLLARALDRVPATVDAIARRDAVPESFAPMSDIAAMSQQYLHSRLFRS
jgi:urease accessory protein